MQLRVSRGTDLKPCILYRRYFVGHPDYRRVQPAEAQAHVAVCRNGCGDFYKAVTLLVTPAEIVTFTPHRPSIRAFDPREHCRTDEDLKLALPNPGTTAFHLLVCDSCRLARLHALATEMRARYEAPEHRMFEAG